MNKKNRTLLIIAFAGPVLGLILAAFRLTLAPPWTSLTGGIYSSLACLGVPIGIIALLIGRIKGKEMVASLILSGIAGIVFLTIISGATLPSGMTNCEIIEAPPSRLRYACVSTSSDDIDYKDEFMLEGWDGFPIMRVIK